MTAPSDHLTAHHAAARQLLEALSDLRPSLFRELAEGAVHLMVDAANALEQRADAAAAVLTHAGEVVDVLEELTEALRDASPAYPELHARAAALAAGLVMLTGNRTERR